LAQDVFRVKAGSARGLCPVMAHRNVAPMPNSRANKRSSDVFVDSGTLNVDFANPHADRDNAIQDCSGMTDMNQKGWATARALTRENIINEGREKRGDAKEKEVPKIFDQSWFTGIVVLIAVANTLVLGFEVDYGCKEGWLACSNDQRGNWYIIEIVITLLMVGDIAIRIFYGPRDYFIGDFVVHTLGFHVTNCIDFTIVFLRALDTFILAPLNVQTVLKILSCFRVLHVTQIIAKAHNWKQIREVWMILHGIWNASRVVFWTVIVLLMILWVSAIILTDQVVKQGPKGHPPELYDYSMSAWTVKPWTVHDYWGSVPQSLLSLFQIVTLDHWCSTLVRPLVTRYSSFMILFVPFLIITVLSLMNVIVAVIVESTLQSAAVNSEKQAREAAKFNQRIMSSLKEVFEQADEDGSGELDKEELKSAWKHQHVRDRMKLLGLEYKDLEALFDTLDDAGTGNIKTNTFFRGCTRLRGVAMACDLHHMSVDFNRYSHWCSELARQHHSINDRLAYLLADIEGLDRDIVKGRTDEQDPVLVGRRRRYQRQMEEELAANDPYYRGPLKHANSTESKLSVAFSNTWDEDSDMAMGRTNADGDGRNSFHGLVANPAVTHEHHEHEGGHGGRGSLVGHVLRKTDIGMDLNELRAAAGVEHKQSLEEEYDDSLRYRSEHTSKSTNPYQMNVAPKIDRRDMSQRRAVLHLEDADPRD